MEEGTRVPLIVMRPGIPRGVQSDVMVNGLDFTHPARTYKLQSPKGLKLDGCNLKPLLLKDRHDPTLVKCTRGKTRDTMV